ncbi:MAG: hypothetical protein IPJ82_20235 [Lewinellaceae bacterium]|nr:hypothetical protein [Lewinellaceae bacterium]
MRDFTIAAYKNLLVSLKEAGYSFATFSEFIQKKPGQRLVMLRHDVDDRKLHSLEFARIQRDMGIVGTYYFRMVPESFDEDVIREIHRMGHEIGYHYEDMDFAGGDPAKAVQLFEQHLETLRKIVPVSTICMHGSPKSKYDNKDVWKHYDYKKYGIIGEPYFDIDFKQVFYVTDTGRQWDGHKVSVRDKVANYFNLSFHTTFEIINCVKNNKFPNIVMFNFHPQRWTDNTILWIWEKYVQNIKNLIKFIVIKLR